MEKKNCPYCGGEIKATAMKCWHCGEWINEVPQSSTKTYVQSSSRQSKSQAAGNTEVKISHSITKMIVLTLLGIGLLSLIIWIIVQTNQKSDWEKAMEEYNSQTSYPEEIPAVEEPAIYYDESQGYPQDSYQNNEYEDYSGNGDGSYQYDPNSGANSWE